MEIKIEEIWAANDSELEKELNDLGAHHIISIEKVRTDDISKYKIIYEK